MLCDNCGQRRASYHRGQLHLCINCVQELVLSDFGDIDFFENFNTGEIFETFDTAKSQKATQKTCDLCGTKTSDITKTGRVGCSKCYSVFAVDVKNMIDIVQGASASHTGKGVT